MVSSEMILAAIAVMAISGFSAYSAGGQRLATLLMLLGSGLGLSGVVAAVGAPAAMMTRPWFLPWGQFTVGIDAISVVFLAPVFVIPALGSLYGLGYWKLSEHLDSGRRLGAAYGMLAAAMAMVVIARDGVLFLIAWELMAMAAYFAATAEDDNLEVRQAGWVYLIATHIGTLCLMAMFALWHRATGSFSMVYTVGLSAEVTGPIFILAVIGFGFKAGLMPLHVWLPGAHANAPSHVSAVMSGVMLKMGIYGIVRMTGLMETCANWWGGTLLVAGAVTGIVGIAFALSQRDFKRVLAYSSIENIGIIAMGLGLALLGRSIGRPVWVTLGLAAALLHVWNHGLFKGLLFLNAGAIIHAVHTRDIEQLGGLAKRMPQTMMLFCIGAAAICALPPLNGFASEWLLYVGLFDTLGLNGQAGYPRAAVAVMALAIIGALATACFVKLLGTVFLGLPRSQAARHAHHPPIAMTMPMVVLTAGCLYIGLFPASVSGVLTDAVTVWSPSLAVTLSAEFTPLAFIGRMAAAFWFLLAATAALLNFLPHRHTAAGAGTWDCGYACPTARIQYTGSSFGQMLESLFGFVLWPKTHWPSIGKLFAERTEFNTSVPDMILERLTLPVFLFAARLLPSLRILQKGKMHLYLLYILVIVIVLLCFGYFGA